jgi:hypothetical protein
MVHGHNPLMGSISILFCLNRALGRFVWSCMAKLFQVTWPYHYGTPGLLQIQKHRIFKSTVELVCLLRCPLQSAKGHDGANAPLRRSTPNQVLSQATTLPKCPQSYWQAIGALHQVLESKETSCLDVK